MALRSFQFTTARELLESARSSQYGLKSPARGERPAQRTPEKRLSFGNGTWERDLAPPPRSALNTQVHHRLPWTVLPTK
jgi:hypothetical protein